MTLQPDRPATTPAWIAVLLVMTVLLGGCGGPARTAGEMNASYELALVRTQSAAVEHPTGDAAARLALARVASLFDDMTESAVRENVAATYARDAYLNDNLTVVEGADAIEDYFAHTLQQARGLDVEFLDVARDGVEHFVRWRMTVTSDRLNGGAPVVSYGMTHFRFDASGRILLHRDFWDAGTGVYEYLPVLGPVVRRVRAMAEGD